MAYKKRCTGQEFPIPFTNRSLLELSGMGYSPQVGTSREGHPIYLYTDEHTNLTNYVVVLPDGRAFYSDAHGRFVATAVEPDKQIGLAIIGGLIGFAFGGAGAILGALIGAAAGGLLNKKGA